MKFFSSVILLGALAGVHARVIERAADGAAVNSVADEAAVNSFADEAADDAAKEVKPAHPHKSRTAAQVLKHVRVKVDALDDQVKHWSGDQQKVLDAVDALTAAIESGTADVKHGKQFSISELTKLASAVDELKEHAETLVKDLKAKKPEIEKHNLCALLRTNISKIGKDNKKLSKAIVAKVTPMFQGIAKSHAKAVDDVLADAEKAFNEKNCVDTGKPSLEF